MRGIGTSILALAAAKQAFAAAIDRVLTRLRRWDESGLTRISASDAWCPAASP